MPRTTNRVFWVQQVIIKYIQDMVALDLAVQLVLARKPADRRFIHLQPTTGGAARTLETQGTLASGQLGGWILPVQH